MRPKAGLCSFDEAMGLTLEELAERLNPARYADLPKTKKKPKATNGEMALFKAALVKLVESQTRAVNVRRVFYLAVSAKIVNKTEPRGRARAEGRVVAAPRRADRLRGDHRRGAQRDRAADVERRARLPRQRHPAVPHRPVGRRQDAGAGVLREDGHDADPARGDGALRRAAVPDHRLHRRDLRVGRSATGEARRQARRRAAGRRLRQLRARHDARRRGACCAPWWRRCG